VTFELFVEFEPLWGVWKVERCANMKGSAIFARELKLKLKCSDERVTKS
jgi:hypothetical protein